MGLLGVEELMIAKKVARDLGFTKYECYAHNGVVLCEGGGKDNICRRVAELIGDAGEAHEVYALVDGDSDVLECEGGGKPIIYRLESGNLDELVFQAAKRIVPPPHNGSLEAEEGNVDSKKKVYLAMYLLRKHFYARGKYWSDLASFYHRLSLDHREVFLELDAGLRRFMLEVLGVG